MKQFKKQDIITVCNYVILNGKKSDWNSVYKRLTDIGIMGCNENADKLLVKIATAVFGMRVKENVSESDCINLIVNIVELKKMLETIK